MVYMHMHDTRAPTVEELLRETARLREYEAYVHGLLGMLAAARVPQGPLLWRVNLLIQAWREAQ